MATNEGSADGAPEALEYSSDYGEASGAEPLMKGGEGRNRGGGTVWFRRIGAAVRGVKKGVWQYYGELVAGLLYIWTDLRINRRHLVIAISTVIAAVLFTVALQAMVSRSPIVFVKLSENTVGENDLVVIADPSSRMETLRDGAMPADAHGLLTAGGYLINCTEFSARMARNADASAASLGATPRWIMLAQLMNSFRPSFNTSAMVLVVDSAQEAALNLGRAWSLGPLGPSQVYLSEGLMESLQLRTGNRARLFLDVFRMLELVGVDRAQARSVLLGLFELAVQEAVANRTVDISGLNGTQLAQQIEQALNTSLPPAWELLLDTLPVPANGTTVPLAAILTPAVLEMLFDAAFPAFRNGGDMQVGADVTVMGSFDRPHGKWPIGLGNVAVLEAQYLLFLVRDAFPMFFQNPDLVRRLMARVPGYQPPNKEDQNAVDPWLAAFPVWNYALQVTVQFRERMEAYVEQSQTRDRLVIGWTNAISTAVGYNTPLSFQLPINTALYPMDIPKAFLLQLLVAIVVIMVVLCGMVIYTLLISNVEAKTYEYGMLQAMGVRQGALMNLLVVQSLTYGVPGVLIGLALALLANVPISMVLYGFADLPPDYTLPLSAVLLGSAIGLLMPVVATVVPIRRALSRTLRDALDMYHQESAETAVHVQSLEDMGLDPVSTLLALLMVVAGFGVFYFVPFSFLYFYWGLFFAMVNSTVLGMVVGLAMVSMALQGYLERLLLHMMMLGRFRRCKSLVRKALVAHGARNRKTAVMVTVSIALIIFASVIFRLQSDSVIDSIKSMTGSDVMVFAPRTRNQLPETAVRAFLDGQLARQNAGAKATVKGYTVVPFRMNDMPGIHTEYHANLALYPNKRFQMFYLEENYLDVAYDEYLMYTQTDTDLDYPTTSTNGKLDIVRSLYQTVGTVRLDAEKNNPDFRPPGLMLSGETVVVSTQSGGGTGNLPSVYVDNATRFEMDVYEHYADMALASSDEGLAMGVGEGVMVNVQFGVANHRANTMYLGKPRAMISKFPGMPQFTWLTQFAEAIVAPALLNKATFDRMLNDTMIARAALAEKYHLQLSEQEANLTYDGRPAVQKVLVRMLDGVTSLDRQFVIDGLRNIIQDDRVLFSDTGDVVETMNYVVSLLDLFFYVIVSVSMALCFFVIWTSFNTNVHENSWEFSVLRALGLSASDVALLYVFEALAVVLAAAFQAVFVGLTVGWTLLLNFSVFNNLPVHLYFPFELFGAIFVLAIAVAVLGSALPARALSKREIAVVLKGM